MTRKQLVTYLKKSFFTGAFKTVIVTLSTIVFLPLIIQKVGMETYGLISLTMIFGGMVVFADFGIAKSVTLLIGQDHDKNNVNTIVSSGLMISLSILTLIGFIFAAIVLFNVPIFGEKLQITHSLKNFIIFVGFISLVIMLINNLLVAILEAYYLVHYVNIGFTISSILINVFIYLTSVITDSIYILLMAPVASSVFISLYFLYIIKIHTDVGLTKPDRKQIKSMLSVSYNFFNISLINSLVTPVNKYLLIYITGNSAYLGVYDIALKIAQIANSLLNTISIPLFGVFSNMQEQKRKIFTISWKISLLIFIAYLFGIVLYSFIGNQIMEILDQKNTESLYIISFILIIGLGMNAVAEPFYRALLGLGRLRESFRLKLLIPLFNIILFFTISSKDYLERVSLSYSIAVFLSSIIIIGYFLNSKKYMRDI